MNKQVIDVLVEDKSIIICSRKAYEAIESLTQSDNLGLNMVWMASMPVVKL